MLLCTNTYFGVKPNQFDRSENKTDQMFEVILLLLRLIGLWRVNPRRSTFFMKTRRRRNLHTVIATTLKSAKSLLEARNVLVGSSNSSSSSSTGSGTGSSSSSSSGNGKL